MFDTKTAYSTGASSLSDGVLLTFLKKMHGTKTSDVDWIVRAHSKVRRIPPRSHILRSAMTWCTKLGTQGFQMLNRFELKQLREAAEKYTYHDAGTHGSGRGSYGNGETSPQ